MKTAISLLVLISFALGFFFLSSNLTGFAVSEGNNTSANVLGVIFILLGFLVEIYIVWKRTEKSKL